MDKGISLLRFDLDASIGVSDLRSEARVEVSLQEHARLRVQRRGEAVGVLVAPSAWRQLVAYVERLERAVADLDDLLDIQDVRAIVAARESDGQPQRLSPDDLTATERDR